jgi:hypothetical protein
MHDHRRRSLSRRRRSLSRRRRGLSRRRRGLSRRRRMLSRRPLTRRALHAKPSTTPAGPRPAARRAAAVRKARGVIPAAEAFRERMSESLNDPVAQAAARLEMAVDRLARAASQPRVAGPAADRAALASLADRLDETVARLRAALREREAEAEDEEVE